MHVFHISSIIPFIYKILSERTFKWGINLHINDLKCVILSVMLLYGDFFDIK